MKIITNDSVYVQLNDIYYLHPSYLTIPFSIFKKASCDNIFLIDDNNKCNYIKFDEKKEIYFFNEMDWILDYKLINGLNENEICTLIIDTKEKKDIITEIIMKTPKNSEDIETMHYQCRLLNYKINSLMNILQMKKENMPILIPNDIVYSLQTQENEFKILKKTS